MNEQTSTNGPEQPTQTSYTTVTYKTLEKGLSITISETITITNNNNFENFPINNKSYELILVPTTDNIKTVVVPNSISNEKPLLPPVATLPPPVPPPPTTTTATAAAPNVEIKPSPTSYPLQPTKPISDANFAYIDESSDDHSVNSKNGILTKCCSCIYSLYIYPKTPFIIEFFIFFNNKFSYSIISFSNVNFRRCNVSRFYHISVNNVT